MVNYCNDLSFNIFNLDKHQNAIILISNKPFFNLCSFLKLKSKAEFNHKVKSIALADRGDGSLPQSCVVSGWGRTKEESNMSVKLLEANVTLTDDERCAKEMFYCSKGETGPGKVSTFL